jgi:NAD(P)-dependent dehydrogenase (short-subunit alcohol dehydrogenase family)
MSMPVPPVSALLDLSGRTALVTGASGNIGAGIARRLHEAGATVAIHYSRNADEAEGLAGQLGSRAIAVMGDVERDAEAICAQTISAFGRLDVVVSNAGIQPVAALMDLHSDQVAEVMRVNVGGVIAMTRAAAAHLPSGSAIVNIASIEGLQAAVGHSHYSASKAAVIMHTKAAANELGSLGIRVNAVAPGLIHVDGIEAQWPDGVNRWQSNCPLQRLGEPEDVADAALFLASPAARWITGATLVVDGGVLTCNTW